MWARRTVFIRAVCVEGMIIELGDHSDLVYDLCYIFIYDKLGGVLFLEMFKMTPPHPFVLQLSLILLGSAWLSA